MSAIHVTVPIVFWGRKPPSHEITCICVADEEKGIATGSKTGQICIWDLYRKEEVVLRPRLLLFGSHGAILALSFCKNWSGDRDRIVSLCDRRLICLWDGKDGTCIKTNNILAGRHSGIKSFSLSNAKETLIAVWGHYSSLHILESNTLESVCTLKSSHNPNWVSQICFIHNVDRKDALAAITVDGVFKLWLLQSTSEMKEMGELFEERSRMLGVKHPLTLSSISTGIHSHSLALVTCRKSWQLYDATEAKMKQLLIRPCEDGVMNWMGGSLLTYNLVVVWAACGAGYLYQIHPYVLPGLEELSGKTNTAGCSLICVFNPSSGLSPLTTPTSQSVGFVPFISQKWHICGNNMGNIQVWHIDSVLKDVLKNSSGDLSVPLPHTTAPHVPPQYSASLSDSWSAPASPCSLTDPLYPEGVECPDITCSLYLTKFGRLICGHSNGEIAVLFAIQSATNLLLQKRKFSRTWPQHYILKGHTGRVTTLMYPGDHSSAYDSNHLLSGGSDFAVRLWDLYKGTLLHTFGVHGGDVKLIITCPPDANVPRIQTCVCSIAEDNSVAILSTSQSKCLMLASCHTAPVKSVHWRLEEDFLLVHCTDGKLYVWQIETGTLDRCVDGERAQMILKNEKTSTNASSSLQPSSPIQVRSLSFGKNHSLVQVILFDPQFLITKLLKMEKIEIKPRQVQHPSQARAFRTYLSARKSLPVLDSQTNKAPSPVINKTDQSPGMARSQARAMEAIGDAMVGGRKEEVMKPESPTMTINIARLLVSCLHAWDLDVALDRECESVLGLVRPCKPVSYGLLSRSGSLSLVLPGWGLVKGTSNSEKKVVTPLTRSMAKPKGSTRPYSVAIGDHIAKATPQPIPQATPTPVNEDLSELAFHIRWQLSRSLTTQHLLTAVSITNTLMNQTVGAHSLAASSGVRTRSESSDSDGSSDEDVATKDNRIKATWSRVAALHCVMLPERLANYFRPPHLPVLASRFMDQNQAIREAAQALLHAELRRVGVEGRRQLVSTWSTKLFTPTLSSSAIEEHKQHKATAIEEGIEMGEVALHATPTQQQQITALVILGMIGAEFNSSGKITPSQSRKSSKRRETYSSDHNPELVDILDPSTARQTAKCLQGFLLEKPLYKSSLYSSIRCSAAELMGRGFHLWENYIDVPAVVMGLLDLAITPGLPSSITDEKAAKKHHAIKFVAEIARRALNLMVLLRPITIITAIAKEVSLFLVSPHGTSSPHSSLPQIQVGVTPPPNTSGIVTKPEVLLPAAKVEILELMRTVLEKCSAQVSVQLLDVVDIVLFCLDQDELKKRNYMINELFPSLTRLPNISYCVKNRRLAVGSRSGHVGVYDLKQRKTQMINAHTHQVTVLCFSEDGKYLATYSYGESKLSCYLVGSSFFGGVISQTPKCINTWTAIASSSSTPANQSSYIRLEWTSNKSIVLYMPGGIECRYSL